MIAMGVDDLSAEELLARILAGKTGVKDRGGEPSRVYLSRSQYRRIVRWHAALGELPVPSVDYVGDYRILSLEVFDDPSGSVSVE